MKKISLLTLFTLSFVTLAGCGNNPEPTPTPTPEITNYTVSFKNYDGSLLSESIVAKGGTAIYNGVTPTRADTSEYQYTFKGWDQSLENILSDCVRVAQYNETKKSVTKYFTVTFTNYDGSLLYKDTVEEGGTAVYNGVIPTKPENEEYRYEFQGWDQSLAHITSDTTRVAQFNAIKKEVAKQYTVTFKNYDGALLHETIVDEGGTATYEGVEPSRPSSSTYNYTFDGWDLPLNNITSNSVRVAQYKQTYIEYSVKFYSYDGKLLYEDKVHYQEPASYYGDIPTKPNTSTHYYTFKGWDKDLSSITKSIDVRPIFDEFGIKSSVTLNFNNGQDDKVIELVYDESYKLDNPTFPGLNFLGWYLDDDTKISSTGVWKYTDVTSLTAKWETVYYDFTENGDNTYKVSLNDEGKAASEISIPTVYNGVTVTALGENFLKENTKITKVTIPGTIKTIPTNSFYKCTKLKEVNLGEGLITIGSHAFEYCALEKLNIPSTCITIEASAFDYNYSLYQIYIPGSVTTIGAYAFDAIKTSVYICIERSSIPTSFNSNWTKTNTYSIYLNCKSLVEGEEYTYATRNLNGDWFVTILKLAETTTKLMDYTFPDEIEGISDIRIGQALFKDNLYIRNVEFNKVTIIGNYAFQNCTNLQTVTFTSSLRKINGFAFKSCSALTRLEIPENVYEIQEQAFDSCTNLEYIYVPSTVTTIRDYAFDVCNKSTVYTNAHTANPGWSSKWVGSQPVYYDFVSLNEIDDYNYIVQTYMGDDYVTITSLKASAKQKKNLVIPDQIENISDIRLSTGLFKGLSELVSIDVGSGVKKIPNECFANCSKLETVVLHEGVTSINYMAFNHCTKLSSINIPSSLTSIGNLAFDYCTSLKEVFIPRSVSTMGSYAFDVSGVLALLIEASVAQPGWDSKWCGTTTSNKQFVYDYVSKGTVGNFRYAKASNGVTSTVYILGLVNGCTDDNLVVPNQIDNISNIKIANSAFKGNTLTKSIDLGSSVTSIGGYAFDNNISLRSVIIPLNCLVIKAYAFANCSNQCVLNCEASEKPSGWESNWNNVNCQVVWGYVRS